MNEGADGGRTRDDAPPVLDLAAPEAAAFDPGRRWRRRRKAAIAGTLVLLAGGTVAGSAWLGRHAIPEPDARRHRAQASALAGAHLAVPAPSARPSPSPSPSATPDFARTLALTDAGSCGFSPPAEAAWRAMLRYDEHAKTWRPDDRVSLGALRLSPAFEEKAAEEVAPGGKIYRVTAQLPQELRWNGLPVAGLRVSHGSFPEIDDYEERIVTFRATPDEVRRGLKASGLEVPIAPGSRDLTGGPLPCGSMQIERMQNGAALVCSWGC